MISEGLETLLDLGCGSKRALPNSDKQITCPSSSKDDLFRSPVVRWCFMPLNLVSY